MPDKSVHARGWFMKAESDLLTAKRVLEGKGPYDTACFHAQQAAEKYIKGLLAFHERPVPRTHNLEELERLCAALVPAWPAGEMDLAELTAFAVELRYDFEFWPDRQTAEKALATVEAVRDAVLAGVPEEARP
jgi:HEPN domain-containing protein